MSTTFIHQLRSLLPADALVYDRERLQAFSCDALSIYHALPMAAALPTSEAQVAAILRLCKQHQIAVVTRGAGTGLSGGATPVAGCLLLVLSKMKQILELDPLARTARVQPGVRNISISEAAAPYGLYYAPDPSSQTACSIGGNVAENAGGIHCLKYGLTLHHVLGLRAYSLSGELLELGGAGLDGPNDGLLSILIGSEGLLAIITEITVRLLPKPSQAKLLLVGFDSVRDAALGVSRLLAAGLTPAALELMDQASVSAVEAHCQPGYPRHAAAVLLCEMDGDVSEVDADIASASVLLLEMGTCELRVAQSEDERQRLWRGRKAAFAAAGRLSPDYYCMDCTIPRAAIAEVLAEIAQLSQAANLACINVFHAGDGNLHPLILFDASIDGQLAKVEALGNAIAACCVAAGGAISGEHGIGLEKLDAMCMQFTTAELVQMQAIKAAFDPEGLLNPGKLIPQLHRCAEVGRMHIHHGQLPHPDLPRF